RHAQCVEHLRAMLADAGQVEQGELGIKKRAVECGIVNDELGAGDELDKLFRNVAEFRLVAQKFLSEPVHLQRAVFARAPRGYIAMKMIAGKPAVDDLDRRDLDHAVAELGIEARGFSVEYDLAHDPSREA